ncbi:DUF935 domain-containing protein [Pseudoxanthomonas winnipegensis]|uniref:DUF935 domain-containing protein n=1 Tax=Pseudoxanthomonas winnipegensis TaxID=2480810 RepID=UPI0013F165A9|nr:DUF935 family protein [Pseudoxanthomonas winnipegensis]
MSEETIPKPKIDVPASSGDGDRHASAYLNQVALPADRLLRTRGAGDLAIYERVLEDPEVASAFLQRRNAVLAREWRVEAGGDRRIDKKAAEHLQTQLHRIGFDNLTDKMLYAVFYGFSVAEVLWDAQDGLYGWKGIKVRRRRNFKFTNAGELRRYSKADIINGVPALPPYFWHIATGGDNDDEPYGLGLAHWCYWPVLFKRQGLKFWLIFLDKFGMPTAHGKFPSGASQEEKNRLLQAAQAIATDSAVITPDGMVIDLIEAARSGTADYKILHDTMNATITKAIIGQTASSSGTPGRLGNDDLQADVRLDIIKADADLVCESLNLGPVRWMTMFNFPGAALPRVFRVIEEPEDADTLAERDKKVKDMGFKPGLKYVKETYGDHWEEATPAVQPGAAPADPVAPEFTEPDQVVSTRAEAQARIDQLVDGAQTAGADWKLYVGPRVAELQQLLDQVDDLQAYRQRVIELAEAEPNSDLIEALARAQFAARLLGRIPKETS